MKLLLVSDLHYALKQYDWTASVAKNFDVVVIAGDHLDIAGRLDGSIQIVVILRYLKMLAARAKTFIVSSGNHDLDRRNSDGEKIAHWMSIVRQMGIPTDGGSIERDGVLITICPWWDGPKLRDTVHAQIARDATKPKKKWIWVYHAPPDGAATSWDGKQHYGDKQLTQWIGDYKPDFVLSGHIHQAPFRNAGSWVDRIGDCWVFNCGQQIGPTPTHIVIDTNAEAAAWFSIEGAESVRLDKPLYRRETLTAPPAWLGSDLKPDSGFVSPDPGRIPA